MKKILAIVLPLIANALFIPSASAQQPFDAQWIWAGRGEPAKSAPAGKVWFRREVRANDPSTGEVRVLGDDRFTLWVNGRKVGAGGAEELYRYNLNGIVGRGPNVIAVEAENISGRAGLFVDGEIRSQRGQYLPFDSGPQWRATFEKPDEAWLKPGFDTSRWQPVVVIGPHEKSPWSSIALKESELDHFSLAPGFKIGRIADHQLVGSIVAITWGNRGRLLASRERGPVLAVIDGDGDGVYDQTVEYTSEVKNCQGLCMVGDDLYAVGDGPQGTGIYRLPDRDHDDRADSVTLIHKHRGGMGEHGPHAVVFGPDGWLYHNMGNHAWCTAEREPTSPVRESYEGTLLEPKFEDARGHARGIKAPGGTIWRFSPDGEFVVADSSAEGRQVANYKRGKPRFWCETAGFRNEYDIAFNARGDLFTFDSDMEWDVGMPWYRPVRVNHCIPGAEFGWRSGAAKWPPYYFDSLPGTVDIGRGSPTGVVFYEHRQFPEKYRGSLIICDWSMGRIMAVFLGPDGATYSGTWENLVTGNPLNVSDIEVARDGSLVFATGGRGTQGGIYRVSYKMGDATPADAKTVHDLLDLPQIHAAWAREIVQRVKQQTGETWSPRLLLQDEPLTPQQKIRALTLLCQFGPRPDAETLIDFAQDRDPAVRAFAAWLLGDYNGAGVRSGRLVAGSADKSATTNPGSKVEAVLRGLLIDPDPMVRRRACEAFVRSGITPPAEPLLSFLSSEDRWLRYAARLALERVPVERIKRPVFEADDPHRVLYGMLALYRRDALPEKAALKRLGKLFTGDHHVRTPTEFLDAMRMTQLVLIRSGDAPSEEAQRIGRFLLERFPTGHPAVDREAARLIAFLQIPGGVEKIVAALEQAGAQKQQIHYALCLRYLKTGWNDDLKRRLLDWYEGTRDWEGGHSFAPYLANIVGGTLEVFTPQDRKRLIGQWRERPFATGLLLSRSSAGEIADFEQVIEAMLNAPASAADRAKRDELISAAIDALGRGASPAAQEFLRKFYDRFPDRRDRIARSLANYPTRENWPYLVRSLRFGDQTTLQLCLRGLRRTKDRPEAAPEDIRDIILAGLKLQGRPRTIAVAVLQQLTGSRHEAGDDPGKALARYQQWFHEKHPDQPPAVLPKVDRSKARYTYQQLLEFLERDPRGRSGNVERGKEVFAKANCIKCHRFGNEGENVGPDLTSVRRRFQRKEIIESLVFPSQVISDQYRMVSVATEGGLVHHGMPVEGASDKTRLTLLLPDATKLEIPRKEIALIKPSKTSVMPEGALNELTLEEIADLFAFLETSKFNPPTEPAPQK